MKTPPNHESGRASKLSKPSLLSLFSPFLRSSREEKLIILMTEGVVASLPPKKGFT
jgi:hypothetical protein